MLANGMKVLFALERQHPSTAVANVLNSQTQPSLKFNKIRLVNVSRREELNSIFCSVRSFVDGVLKDKIPKLCSKRKHPFQKFVKFTRVVAKSTIEIQQAN